MRNLHVYEITVYEAQITSNLVKQWIKYPQSSICISIFKIIDILNLYIKKNEDNNVSIKVKNLLAHLKTIYNFQKILHCQVWTELTGSFV